MGTLQKATRKLRVVRVGLRQMDGIGFRLFGNLTAKSPTLRANCNCLENGGVLQSTLFLQKSKNK